MCVLFDKKDIYHLPVTFHCRPNSVHVCVPSAERNPTLTVLKKPVGLYIEVDHKKTERVQNYSVKKSYEVQ